MASPQDAYGYGYGYGRGGWGVYAGEGAPSLTSVLSELGDLTQTVYPQYDPSHAGSWLEDIITTTVDPAAAFDHQGAPVGVTGESSVLWQACVMAELCPPSGHSYEGISLPESVETSRTTSPLMIKQEPARKSPVATAERGQDPMPSSVPSPAVSSPCSPSEPPTPSMKSEISSPDPTETSYVSGPGQDLSPAPSLDSSGYMSGSQIQDFSPCASSPQGPATPADDTCRIPPPDVTTYKKVAPGVTSVSQSTAESAKPNLPYLALIANAIFNMPSGRALLSDIYGYVMDTYPYYRTAAKAWKNSIRHNLSVNECFMKAGRAESGRGYYWSIHPSCIEPFKNGDYQRREARRRVQRANTHPYARNGVTPSTATQSSPAASPQPTGERIYQDMSTVYPVYGGQPLRNYMPYPSLCNPHQGQLMPQGHHMMLSGQTVAPPGYMGQTGYYYSPQTGYYSTATYRPQPVIQQGNHQYTQ